MECKRLSIVGVVVDFARIDGNSYRNNMCSVFGIDEEEHACFKKHGVDVFPKDFTYEADKFLVHTNAWKAMRILGLFGYTIPITPIGGTIDEADTGNRMTVFYTLHSTTRWK
jgi:hypothetical protein